MDMCLNLGVIDWTAIGTIATSIMVVATFVTIYISIKQDKMSRGFQTLLIKQQQAQQKLDDMVNNVLNINNNINPFHILHYSNKLTAKTFTEDDRQALEKLAVDDSLNNTNLTLQMIRLNNYSSAKSLLDCLHQIRADYGLWQRTVTSLYQYVCFSKESKQQIDIIEQTVIIMTTEMINKCIEISPELKSVIPELQLGPKPIDKALTVLQIFEAEIAKYILTKKDKLETELIQFVKSEQQRIDNIIKQK
ncbi:hypothetical protein [Alistipes finegoldii]|jgi:hypothetical protein|uniref:hypothetical protein n=1 Tax=Alistipes finegoldii TaxID=214856 RepID=UPI0024301238|nr:hypothetical protein [Alistipes finegoldii]